MSETKPNSLSALFRCLYSGLAAVVGGLNRALIWLVTAILRVWHYVFAPWFGVRCRFEPSCSEYSVEAFRRFGLVKGTVLTLYRVFRCHPLCKGGADPVPERFGLARK